MGVLVCILAHIVESVGILRKTLLSECTSFTLLWLVKSLANAGLTVMWRHPSLAAQHGGHFPSVSSG